MEERDEKEKLEGITEPENTKRIPEKKSLQNYTLKKVLTEDGPKVESDNYIQTVFKTKGNQQSVDRKKLSLLIENVHKEETQGKVNFSIWDYFLSTVKSGMKISLTPKQKLFMKSQNLFNDQSDMVFVLKKLMEFEKMKEILMTDEQNYLFDLISKPIIYNDKSKNKINRTRSSLRSMEGESPLKSKPNDQKKFNQMNEFFERRNENNSLTEIDLRLLKMAEVAARKFKS